MVINHLSKCWYLGLISLILVNPTFGGDAGEGTVTGKVYTNWSYDFTDDSTFEAETAPRSSFELSRVYLGYKHKFNDAFNANITLDVERDKYLTSVTVDTLFSVKTKKGSRYSAYIKTAYVEWKDALPFTSFQAGMIPLFQFNTQEKFWGYRYIFKSFMDDNNFGSSADLGLSFNVKPSKLFEVKFAVTHGEGYKNTQDASGTYRPALLIETSPVSGLIASVYGDYMPFNSSLESLVSAAGFVGYSMKDKFRLGVEYDYQMNQKGIELHDMNGFSVMGSYIINPVEIFARYDKLFSVDDWNLGSGVSTNDGSKVIAGIQYSPIKNIKIALDYQGFIPEQEAGLVRHKAFTHVEFGF